MKKVTLCLLALLSAAGVQAQSKFYGEAGASYYAVNGAKLPRDPDVARSVVVRNDTSGWAPYLAAGYAATDAFGLRLSYHYLGDVSGSVERTFSAVPEDYVVTTRFNDDVHVLALAPELKWRTSDTLSFSLSPELNWVVARQEILTHTTAPAINVIPRQTQTEREFTFGGSIALQWAWSPRAALSLNYKYVDLDPSWSREAHVFSAGVRWSF